MLDGALVEIDEEAGWGELGLALLFLVEFDGSGDGVGGATAELALVVDGGAAGERRSTFWLNAFLEGAGAA